MRMRYIVVKLLNNKQNPCPSVSIRQELRDVVEDMDNLLRHGDGRDFRANQEAFSQKALREGYPALVLEVCDQKMGHKTEYAVIRSSSIGRCAVSFCWDDEGSRYKFHETKRMRAHPGQKREIRWIHTGEELKIIA